MYKCSKCIERKSAFTTAKTLSLEYKKEKTMSLVTKIKHYNELTTDELYRCIQLRVDGFIVKNKTCYQDLEAHYDKNQWYMMTYDTVLGLEPITNGRRKCVMY